MDFSSCFSDLQLSSAVYTVGATSIGLAVLALWVSRHDYFFGRAQFLAANFGMIWWLLVVAMELATPTLECKTVFALSAWPAIAIVPVSWCFFLLHFCFGMQGIRSWVEPAITVIVVLSVTLMAVTNPIHQMFYGPGTMLIASAGQTSAAFDHGSLFYLAAAILYVFLLGSLIIAGIGAFVAGRAMRPMLLMLLFGTAVPMAANIAYLVFGMSLAGFDPTPFAFAFILMVFTWSIYANRSFDLTTVARDLLYFNVSDPVVVINPQGQVAGVNPPARQLLPMISPGTRLPEDGPLADMYRALDDGAEPGVRTGVEIADRIFDLRVLPIPRPLAERSAPLGAVAILSDVTALRCNARRLEAALEDSRAQLAEITRLREIAETAALTDALTGLGNRRLLAARFAMLGGGPVALALLDIDCFKQLNDRLGHSVGDRVLKSFSGMILATLPDRADAFRVGGEEFLIVCPDMPTAGMVQLLNQLARSISDNPLLRGEDHPQVTFSAGVAVRPGDGESFDDLFKRADARLYEAKRAGRNRVMHLDGMPFDNSPDQAEVSNTGRFVGR